VCEDGRGGGTGGMFASVSLLEGLHGDRRWLWSQRIAQLTLLEGKLRQNTMRKVKISTSVQNTCVAWFGCNPIGQGFKPPLWNDGSALFQCY
jgi:hypothetical protein